jgi:hypothetical protein
MKNEYRAEYLSNCTSYEEEVSELRRLISGKPDDVRLLKNSYESLTGKRYYSLTGKRYSKISKEN